MSASGSRSAVVLQLAEEFLERYRQGQRPSLKEYIDRRPDLAAEIKEVFPAMALMENVALDEESLAGAATGPEIVGGAAPPEQLGDYRILREVGRGGMGIVYEAEQVSLGRHVALKVLPRKVLLDEAQKRRFEREAKAAAKLHHTNIVPVFGVGEHEGLPYYVMQFIQGLGLDDVLEELKRMQGGSTPATGGELRVSRKDVSAADVARSLLTGAFPQGEPAASAAGSPESSGKVSDSYTVTSAVKLPSSHVKGKKATYWQSVAHIGLQVAEALEYAHKQGIQHRDIKPSNLLLDTAGTVWVTDFGLARADNEDHLTQTGDIVGTLRYMPPEAFEGRADKRGDIYSLGLTLYEMLARQPAFAERDRHRLIKCVTTEEPARLDKLPRAIPRDLVTIVHKAIDREPSRRYATAGEFSADLQRFLEDEPIHARPISNGERLWRWCRRHPGVASLTGILVLLLIGVTAASLLTAAYLHRVALHEAQVADREIRIADKERQARQEADKARDQETTLREQAEQSKHQAEANFAKAQKAVNDYFTTVSESQLLQVPGMQPLRRDLLQSALTFYQDFLKERNGDPSLRGDVAAALLRVGKIRYELGEQDEARKACKQASELYEELRKAEPESVPWRHGLAECYLALGSNGKAIALWEKLVQPGQPRFQKELANAYNAQGINHDRLGRLEDALQAYQKSQAIREMLILLNPDDPDAQRDLSGSLNNIGILLEKQNRRAEALALYRRASEHSEIAFARAPQVLLNGRYLAIQHFNIASAEQRFGHVNEALAAYRRAVEVWRKLARDNPAVPGLHSKLFEVYRYLANYQRELKQIEESERTLRLAREVIDRLPREGAVDLFNLACVQAQCSTLLAPAKGQATAEERAEQKHEADLAMEALSQAVAAGFRNAARLRTAAELKALHDRDDFKALQAELTALLAATPPDKLKANQQALALRRKAAQADPKNRRLRADLAASQHAIALIQFDFGKLEEGKKHLQQAVALREALVKDEPKNAQYQADLALSRLALGDYHWRSGRVAEGAKGLQGELEKLEATMRQRKDHFALADQLFAMRRRIAEHFARAGLWTEAAAHYGRVMQGEGVSMQDHFRAACLALRAGDAAAYRRIGERMAKRVSDPREPYAPGWLAWADVLADHDGANPAAAIQQTQAMTDKNPLLAWQCHVLALAHYRAGRFAEAITQASNSNDLKTTWPSHVLNGPVMAMAHHRLGHAAESRKWLENAVADWRRLSPLPHALGSTTVLPSASEHWQEAWQDWPTFEILLHEASALITGAPPVEAAYDRAHRSLLYRQLGDSEKAEAEWQAAVQMVPREPALWLARGRLFAQLGQHAKADADFAQAAARTPEELNKFLESGWWVVGPYPADINLSCPPEKNPDPSRPVAAIGRAGPLHWQPAATEQPDGQVNLRAIFKANNISAYALTYVYSPQERTATLLVGGDDRIRIWLNGRLVHQMDRKVDWPWELDRVPVTLKAGRNTLLCKVSQDLSAHYLYLRLADNPFDRAHLHAQLGLWDEAAAESARAIDRQPPTNPQPYRWGIHAQLMASNPAAYRRYLARMFERYDKESYASFELAYAGGLLDGAVKPARLVELAEHTVESGRLPFFLHASGMAYYRAGQFDKTIERLQESLKNPDWQSGGGHASELGIALAYHRLGHAEEARQWLDKAEQWYDKAIQDALASPTATANLLYWMDWPSFIVLRREAHKQILGKELPDDPRLKQLADRMRDRLKKLDPATADYDVAFLLSPNEPRLRLARARRFVELRRDKEAAADFAQALNLAPKNSESLRQRIYAELDRSSPLLAQIAALRPQDEPLAAFLRARDANAQGSGPAGIVLAGNLLNNGSFEKGPELGGEKSRGYKFFATGSTEIPGWIVSRGSVEVGSLPWYVASRGRRCLDLDGDQPGGIRQTVKTKIGQKYRLVFDLAGNPYSHVVHLPSVKKLRVQAAGASADFAFDVTGRSGSNLGWVGKQWEFTATSSETTVEFLSLDEKGGCGPLLDNIVLMPVGADEKAK